MGDSECVSVIAECNLTLAKEPHEKTDYVVRGAFFRSEARNKGNNEKKYSEDDQKQSEYGSVGHHWVWII